MLSDSFSERETNKKLFWSGVIKLFTAVIYSLLSIEGFVKIARIGTVTIPPGTKNHQNCIVTIPSRYWNHIGGDT
jgi:hypothetical protein